MNFGGTLYQTFFKTAANFIRKRDLNSHQIKSLAETLREISANLVAIEIITLIIEGNTNYLRQVFVIGAAAAFWYTNFIVYKYL